MTLAYIAALAAAVTAFDGGVSFAQVGAVYLGASIVAAAAPTPGGLGAMEAALVAGFTGVGMEPGVAVAAVLALPLGHLLAADPARVAQLPAPRAQQPDLAVARSRGQRGGTPTPPRPNAHRENVPASRPTPIPPATSRGRWAPP